MTPSESIDPASAIPHAPPFRLLDRILELDESAVRAQLTLRPEDEFWSRVYAGHYPGNPITPGVLLCEMIFQAGAALVGKAASDLPGVPVVTRIQNVKFKAMVLPGERVEIRAEITEKLANAFYMKGSVIKNGRPAVLAEFTVAIAPPPPPPQQPQRQPEGDNG